MAHEEAFLIVVGIDEPAGDAAGIVGTDFAGRRVEDVDAVDLDANAPVGFVENVDVGLAEDDEEVTSSARSMSFATSSCARPSIPIPTIPMLSCPAGPPWYYGMMSYDLLPGAYPSEPVRPGAHGFGEWLTVSEGVIYCVDKGLARTQKTVRKWAHRSHLDPVNAEITVRREDVDNGFRWVIERSSLDRKIEQELEFEARRAKENDDPVPTGVDTSGQMRTGTLASLLDEPEANPSAQVDTGAHVSAPVRDEEDVITQLEAYPSGVGRLALWG